MNIIKSVWLFLSLMGNGTQIYQISSLFFSYSVLTKVFLIYPEKTSLPSLAVCFYIGDLVKWEELFNEYPKYRSELGFEDKSTEDIVSEFRNYNHDKKLEVAQPIMSTLTSKQIMDMTEKIPDYVFRTILMNQTKLKMDITTNYRDYWKPKEFLRECFKCASFDNNVADGFYKYHDVFRDGKSNGFAYEISFNETMLNRTNRVLILLHERFHYPRSGKSRGITVRDLSKLFVIKYMVYKSFLLPAPYTTDCVDFREQKMEDSGHCYELCARAESIKNLDGKLFPGPVISEEDNYPLLSLTNLTKDVHDKIAGIKRSCTEKCGQLNCTDYVTCPYIGSKTDFDKMIYDVFFPEYPNIVTEYSPYLSLVPFIVSMLSTIGFWIGVSVLDANQVIEGMFLKHDKKLNRIGSDEIKSGQFMARRKSTLVDHIINRRVSGDTESNVPLARDHCHGQHDGNNGVKVCFETRHRLPRTLNNSNRRQDREFECYIRGLMRRYPHSNLARKRI